MKIQGLAGLCLAESLGREYSCERPYGHTGAHRRTTGYTKQVGLQRRFVMEWPQAEAQWPPLWVTEAWA